MTNSTSTISVFFDGTGINLGDVDRSVIGEAYLLTRASGLTAFGQELPNPDNNLDAKMYFAGPSASSTIYIDEDRNQLILPTPGSKTAKQFGITSAHKVSNYTGITSAGSEHNLHLAVKMTKDYIKKLGEDVKQVNIKVAGYSRGGITAIAFTNEISKWLQSEYVRNKSFSLKVHLIDPVAGVQEGVYSKDRAEMTEQGLQCVEPYRLGAMSGDYTIHLATQEKREPFKPQIPFGLDRSLENNRPLLVPDRVNLTIRMTHACHQTIAYSRYNEFETSFAAGERTHHLLTGQEHRPDSSGDYRVLSDTGTAKVLKNEARNISMETSLDNPEKVIVYSNSVLYDYYNIYTFNHGTEASFYDALTNKDNPHHEMACWAYFNSNFYHVTEKEPGDVDENVLAQAVQYENKHELKVFAENYKEQLKNDPVDMILLRARLSCAEQKKLVLLKELKNNNQLDGGLKKYSDFANEIIARAASHKVEMLYQAEERLIALDRKVRSLDRRGFHQARDVLAEGVNNIRTELDAYKTNGKSEHIHSACDVLNRLVQDKHLAEHRGMALIFAALLKPLQALGFLKNKLQTDSMQQSMKLRMTLFGLNETENMNENPTKQLNDVKNR